MAVEDHPRYAEWLAAFDHRIEAERRFIRARLEAAPGLEAARRDFEDAQRKYNEIVNSLDDDEDA